MSIYSFVFLFATIGMLIIARRNRALFYETSFARFMGVLGEETANLWHAHLRERSFLFLEKTLRAIRIWFLRMENRLLKFTYFVRGIKEKNSAGGTADTEE